LLPKKNAWKTIFWYFGVTFQGQTSLLAVFKDSGGFQTVEYPNIQEHHNIITEIQNVTFFADENEAWYKTTRKSPVEHVKVYICHRLTEVGEFWKVETVNLSGCHG